MPPPPPAPTPTHTHTHKHNVEPRCDITVGSYRKVNIDVIQHIAERETTQVRMIPNLHRKIEDLNKSFFIHLFVVQPSLFYSILDFNRSVIYQSIFSLKYNKITVRA